jgi:hypothetical protein
MQCDLLKVPWLWSAESSADLGAKSALVHGRNLLGKVKATSEWERVMVSRSVCDELGSCVSEVSRSTRAALASSPQIPAFC